MDIHGLYPQSGCFQIPERRSSLFNIGNFATAMERFDGDGLGDKWSTGLWVTWYASIMAGVSCAMDSAGNRSMLPTSSNQVEFVVLAGMAKGIVHRYWWHFRYIIIVTPWLLLVRWRMSRMSTGPRFTCSACHFWIDLSETWPPWELPDDPWWNSQPHAASEAFWSLPQTMVTSMKYHTIGMTDNWVQRLSQFRDELQEIK